MPGSIHVSVLDFNELPSSSQSSSILVKASMGKSDYQTLGKGNLSLPLKTLRENVKITLHDANGNELSQAGVQTISIVEKGYLDESLSLEGGGTVRLKLRFVLNDEERNKIRRVRESAMKRKHDELLTGSPRTSKITPCVHHEVSDSLAKAAQNEMSSIRDQAIEYRERNEAYLKEIIPKEADGSDISQGLRLLNHEYQKKSEEKIETSEKNSHRLVDTIEKEMYQIDVSNTSVMKYDSLDEKIGTSIENRRGLVENNAKEMPQIDAPKTHVIVEEPIEKTISNNQTTESKDASSLFCISRQGNVGDEKLSKTNGKFKSSEENQNRSEENNAVKLDRINFRKRPIKSDDASTHLEAKKPVAAQIEKREPLQKTSSNEMRPVIKPPPTKTEPDKVEIETPKEPLADEKSKPIETDGLKTEECVDADSFQNARHGEDKSTLQTQVEETKAVMKNEQDLGKMFTNKEPNLNNPLNLLAPEEGICDTREDSIGKFLGNEKTMVSDEGTHVCARTEIKQVKDLAGSNSIEERLSQRFSVSENVEKDIKKSGIYNDVNKSGKKKSRDESSTGAETSSGPFGQAIKIAVMVAFGSLILLTRQRKPR